MTESVSVQLVCRRGATLRALKKNDVSVFASLLRWCAFATVPSGTVAVSVVTSTSDTQLRSQMHSIVFRQLLGSTSTDSVLETISSDVQAKSEGSEKRSVSCTIGAELYLSTSIVTRGLTANTSSTTRSCSSLLPAKSKILSERKRIENGHDTSHSTANVMFIVVSEPCVTSEVSSSKWRFSDSWNIVASIAAIGPLITSTDIQICPSFCS